MIKSLHISSGILWAIGVACGLVSAVQAQEETPGDPDEGVGPYSLPLNDPDNAFDAPIPGFVGPDGEGKAYLDAGGGYVFNPNNYTNPLFFGWADRVVDYKNSDPGTNPNYMYRERALGPATGNQIDIVSLGDMDKTAIANWLADPENASVAPGTLTIALDRPIHNLTGADFTVFENGFVSNHTGGGSGPDGGYVSGEFFAEFAYVEVSADGENFVRFPSTSNTPAAVGAYGSVDVTRVHNLVGKHSNAYRISWGTPFDLSDVGLESISYIRVVDIPGSGDFVDSEGNPIYDGWHTLDSGGADIEAFGAISQRINYSEWPQLELIEDSGQRGPGDDPDHDGLTNLQEYALARLPWLGDANEHPSKITQDENGDIFFSFTRDERLSDLTVEIQTTTDLDGVWTTLARSVGGEPFEEFTGSLVFELSESSASHIASVGVLRKVNLRVAPPASGQRFFRVKIIQDEA